MASGSCDICGKSTAFGRNIRHQHSGKWERKAPVTSRFFRPNVHKKALYFGGAKIRLNICTRCLRSQVKLSA
jgi:large subunit ribosomal protein L28